MAHGFTALLRFSPDTEPYHQILISVDEDGFATAQVSSPSGDDLQPFQLTGAFFQGRGTEREALTTLIFTDGMTVLGLTYGSNSTSANL